MFNINIKFRNEIPTNTKTTANLQFVFMFRKFELNARTEEVKKAKRVNNVEISEKLAKKENGLRKSGFKVNSYIVEKIYYLINKQLK